MERWIDANAVIVKIKQYHDSLKPRYISKLVDAEIADIQDIVLEQPTVDAVEVVRCENCMHYVAPQGTYVCDCFEGLNFATDNDFCSYGERREGE